MSRKRTKIVLSSCVSGERPNNLGLNAKGWLAQFILRNLELFCYLLEVHNNQLAVISVH